MGVIRFKDGSNIELPSDKAKKVSEVLDTYLKTGVDNFIKLQGRRIAISSVKEIEEDVVKEWEPSNEDVEAMVKRLEAYKVNGRLTLESEFRCLQDLGVVRLGGSGKILSELKLTVTDAIAFTRWRETLERAKSYMAWKKRKDEEHLMEIEKTL